MRVNINGIEATPVEAAPAAAVVEPAPVEPAPVSAAAVVEPAPVSADAEGELARTGISEAVARSYNDIQDLSQYVLGELQYPNNTELSISFVDSAEITELNRDFRMKDMPTDVLSFGCDEEVLLDDSSLLPDEPFLLGDIVICPEVAATKAVEQNVSFEEELLILTTHALLHLSGFDHEEAVDAEQMEYEEDRLLTAWADERGRKLSWF